MQMNSTGAVSIHTGQRQSLLTQSLWITAFTALTAIGAQISVPHYPVPYTLQTLFVLLSGAFLGKRNGAISQFAYLLAGAVGLPVFSGFGFGLARLLGPTGGYLLAFPVAAFVIGYILDGKYSYLRILASLCAGLFVIFSLGTVQLNVLVYNDLRQAFLNGFLIFSWWDVLKFVAATMIIRQLSGRISIQPSGR